jgi:hypothetical protein
VIQQDDTDDS